MIDKLGRFSRTVQFLRLPAIDIALLCLISTIYIVFTSNSTEGDFYLVPGIIGFLWAISTLSFLLTFHSVPEKADGSLPVLQRIKRCVNRDWYWILGFAFVVTTILVLVTSYRILSIWFLDYK